MDTSESDVRVTWLTSGSYSTADRQLSLLACLHRSGVEQSITDLCARDLPYPDDSFDAAYLTVVLGEIPDQDGALRELHRVLKPGGHLVVGEVFLDFHMVPFGTLRKRAEAAGFSFERRVGGGLGYFASFGVL